MGKPHGMAWGRQSRHGDVGVLYVLYLLSTPEFPRQWTAASKPAAGRRTWPSPSTRPTTKAAALRRRAPLTTTKTMTSNGHLRWRRPPLPGWRPRQRRSWSPRRCRRGWWRCRTRWRRSWSGPALLLQIKIRRPKWRSFILNFRELSFPPSLYRRDDGQTYASRFNEQSLFISSHLIAVYLRTFCELIFSLNSLFISLRESFIC